MTFQSIQLANVYCDAHRGIFLKFICPKNTFSSITFTEIGCLDIDTGGHTIPLKY